MVSANERHIAHLDLDAFFVSVEILKNSRLRGKPLIVGGDGNRGVVTSCSYEARKFGVHSAMPAKLAKRLCPEAIFIRGDFESYGKYSKLVTDIIEDTVPVFEKSSIDEFYVDLTGFDRFFSTGRFAFDLKEKVVKESGLPVSYGLASNKLISKVATNEVKPNGQIEIPFGSERSFLSPLNIVKIPGIGKQTAMLLYKMGVETVKTLGEIPPEMMYNLLGHSGIDLWRKANGIDNSPVVPYRESKSISTENTFHADTIDINFLHSELVRMTEKIAFQLREQNRLTGCVTVKLRYYNFETFTKQTIVGYTNADHVLLQTAKNLFDKLFERRLLIRLIGVRFSHLIPGNYQINLFDDTEHMINLYQAIDAIKKRFGEKLLVRAVGVGRSGGSLL